MSVADNFRRARSTLLVVILLVACNSQAIANDLFIGKFASEPSEILKAEANIAEIYIVRKGEKYIVTEFAQGEFRVDYEAKPCSPERRDLFIQGHPPGDVYALCNSRTGFVAFVYSQNGINNPMARIYSEQGIENPRDDTYFRAQYYKEPFLAFRRVESFKFAPNDPIKLSSRVTPEFIAQCKSAGVRLMEKPLAPVRSIAYDWDPKRISGWPHVDRIEVDSDGRIGFIGGFSQRNSAEAQKKNAFEFTESRFDPGRSGAAIINPSEPYYHFPGFGIKQPYYGVENLSADILAYLDVDKPDELRKTPIGQGAIRYKITLTDRRSGVMLGVQTFVVDRLNNRACGANVDNAISQAAFIFDAINR